MATKLYLLALTVFLLTLVDFGYSLDCYKCSSNTQSSSICSDPLDLKNVENVTCAHNDAICIKVNRKVKANGDVFNYVIRDCYVKTKNTCGDYQQKLDEIFPNLVNSTVTHPTCTICSDKLCNSSSGLVSSLVFCFFIFTLVKAF